MDEITLRQQWSVIKPGFRAWGNYLNREILSALMKVAESSLIKIPPQPRLKEDDSLIEKVFYRNPGKYGDPWTEIEDFVGTRFVVLLERDIATVQKVIEGIDGITSYVSRNNKELERAHPNSFDYASTHLICRPNMDFKYDDVEIPKGTPCEVQIRTLLQHAWSEVSHSTLYKPTFAASDKMKRSAAKSSALIEATSDYFDSVYDEIARREDAMDTLSKQLTPIYKKHVKRDPAISQMEQQILDSYASLIPQQFDVSQEIGHFLESKQFIAERVQERRQKYFVYKQPSVLLVYWLVANQTRRIASYEYGLPHYILAEIFSDLGKTID